jgi:RNA polymerase sigma-70 factor (ECF subfamily)
LPAAEHFSADPDALVDTALTPSEQAESDEWTDALEEALAKLPKQLCKPLLLVSLDGCSQAEVAARLGCTVKAIEARLYHGRKRLRAELNHILNPWRCRVPAAIRPKSLR